MGSITETPPFELRVVLELRDVVHRDQELERQLVEEESTRCSSSCCCSLARACMRLGVRCQVTKASCIDSSKRSELLPQLCKTRKATGI